MRQQGRIMRNAIRSVKGMSLVELLIVIVLMGILGGMAIPSFIQWRRSIQYRDAATGMMSTLRDARGRAIGKNLQHRVEFEAANRRYRLMRGDQSYNTGAGNWTEAMIWVTLSYEVRLNATANAIVFSPNGSAIFDPVADSATVSVQDTDAVDKYYVTVRPTGRIEMSRP